MSDEERLIEELECCANFCRGVALDPSIPQHAKEACVSMAKQIDVVTEAACKRLGL